MSEEGQPGITQHNVVRHLLALLETTPDVVFVKDLQGRHVFMNRAGLLAVGRPNPEDVVGRTAHEIQPLELADRFERHDEQIRRTGETVEVEEVTKSSEGEQIFMVTKGPCFDAQGNVIGTYGIARNITEQRRLEAKLEQLTDLDHLYETAPVGLCLMDLDLKFVRINGRLAQINGRPVSEHIGRTPREVIPGIADDIEPLYRQVIETGEPIIDLEISGTSPVDPSREVTCIVSYYPVRDAKGAIRGVSTIVHDITDIREAQQTLQNSEQRYRALVEHAPDAIVVLDVKTGHFVDVNQRACEFFGLTRAELLDRGPADLSPEHQPNGRPSMQGAAQKVAEAAGAPRGRQIIFKWMHRHADGHELPAEIRLVRFPDPDRVLLRGSITDISARVAADKALRESEEKYRVVAETATDAIVTIDEHSVIVYANSSAEKVFGYSRDQLIGGSMTRLMPESMQAQHLESLSRFVQTGERHVAWDGLVLRGRHKSGREFPIEISFGSMQRDTGELLFTGIVRDITERVRANEALREREAALQQSHLQLRDLAGKLIFAHEEERRRVARELHDDLTQRLGAMAIEAGKLKNQSTKVSGELGEKVEELRKGIVQLSHDIQSVSRRLHPSILDDLGLVDAIASECDRFSEREGIDVHFTPVELPASVPKNVALSLYRITQESLRNIAKHSKAKTAEICLAVEDHTLKLSIQDSGVGFDSSQGRKKGGLGLASMEERVRLIQGNLTVTSQEDGGTRIEIEAPIGAGESRTETAV